MLFRWKMNIWISSVQYALKTYTDLLWPYETAGASANIFQYDLIPAMHFPGVQSCLKITCDLPRPSPDLNPFKSYFKHISTEFWILKVEKHIIL